MTSVTSSGRTPRRASSVNKRGGASTPKLRFCLSLSFGPAPVSTSTTFVPSRMRRQFISMATRLSSSAGFCFSHSTFGTTPNIAPPSSRKMPSLKMSTSKRPMRIAVSMDKHGGPRVPRRCWGAAPSVNERTDAVRRQFGPAAEAYLASAAHAQGEDLANVVAFLAPAADEVMLDLGCGVGHTLRRVAPHVRLAIGADATPGMLEGARTLMARENIANVALV